VRAGRRRRGGAHAAPRAPRRVGLSALLLVAIGGSLGVLAVLPTSAPGPTTAVAVMAASGGPAEIAPSAAQAQPQDVLDRASRSRLRQSQVVTAQTAAPPVAVPPPPPPPVLPGCDGAKQDLDRYANGRLPSSVLCTVPGSGEALRADAAVAFVRLANAYEAHFGKPICLTDGYRTLAEQRAVRRAKPRLAARPGTSEHGWGLAVDLACGVQSFRSAQHAWMAQNAESYGWHLPSWARRGGAKPEPWHWEYVG
jgi:D-alanyl-D-alanine carboxypeptidase